jgi:hypothetical protein
MFDSNPLSTVSKAIKILVLFSLGFFIVYILIYGISYVSLSELAKFIEKWESST